MLHWFESLINRNARHNLFHALKGQGTHTNETVVEVDAENSGSRSGTTIQGGVDCGGDDILGVGTAALVEAGRQLPIH